MEQKAKDVKSEPKEDDEIIHDFASSSSKKTVSDKKEMNSTKPKQPIILFAILLILGIGTGFVASKAVGAGGGGQVRMIDSNGKVVTTQAQPGTVYGSKDEKTFKDSATGTLKKGGIEGEGAYHLERPGGDSQNVYLTSSVIDLSQFVGKKVQVWGETNAAQKAGWLMDVGRLKIL